MTRTHFLHTCFCCHLCIGFNREIPVCGRTLTNASRRFCPPRTGPKRLMDLVRARLGRMRDSLPRDCRRDRGKHIAHCATTTLLNGFCVFHGRLDGTRIRFGGVVSGRKDLFNLVRG